MAKKQVNVDPSDAEKFILGRAEPGSGPVTEELPPSEGEAAEASEGHGRGGADIPIRPPRRPKERVMLYLDADVAAELKRRATKARWSMTGLAELLIRRGLGMRDE